MTPTVLKRLQEVVRTGHEQIVVSPDMYKAVKHAIATTPVLAGNDFRGPSNPFYGITITVSDSVPQGTIMGLRSLEYMTPGPVKPHSDAADSLAYANMVFALNKPEQTGELKLTTLKERDPYKQIAYIEPGTYDAYRSDGQFILKLTPEGADELIRLNPHILWNPR